MSGYRLEDKDWFQKGVMDNCDSSDVAIDVNLENAVNDLIFGVPRSRSLSKNITYKFDRILSKTDKAILFLINGYGLWAPISICTIKDNIVSLPYWFNTPFIELSDSMS